MSMSRFDASSLIQMLLWQVSDSSHWLISCNLCKYNCRCIYILDTVSLGGYVNQLFLFQMLWWLLLAIHC